MPLALRPPIALALARAVDSIPEPDKLPGTARYEPKWDGFRTVVVVDGDRISLVSRQGKDLGRYFPDLVAAAAQIPPGCVVDGEAVVWAGDRLDFDALQRRMTASRKSLPALVREFPASFVAFDVLAVAGRDVRSLQLRDRRALLEELAREWTAPLNLSPMTADIEQAKQWLDEMTAAGLEGIMIKPATQPYLGNQRGWLKYKRRNVFDVVCAAVIGRRTNPTAIVVGLPIGGRLRIVGRSSQLPAAKATSLGRQLKPPAGEHPWPEEISQRVLDRFTQEKGTVHLTRVAPIVVEISADVAWSGRSFRHSVRFLRTRPELSPAEIQVPPELI